AMCGYELDNDLAVVVPLVIAGGVVGFLRFNTHPARIFMGNAGAYFLGFALGFTALSLCIPGGGESLVTVAMLLGVPFIDAAFLPVNRYMHGRPLFPSDRSHLHHRFLEAGFSHRSSVALIYSFHTALVLAGYALRSAPGVLRAIAFAALATLIESAPWSLAPL